MEDSLAMSQSAVRALEMELTVMRRKLDAAESLKRVPAPEPPIPPADKVPALPHHCTLYSLSLYCAISWCTICGCHHHLAHGPCPCNQGRDREIQQLEAELSSQIAARRG
eukprot:2524609-Rhodomonas_salina.1